MKKVRCYACGKRYDHDEDAFCPHCGAFNQVQPGTRISAEGAVVRVDGLNEENHSDSFVHREVHAESRQRQRSGLDRKTKRKKVNPVSLIFWIIFAVLAVNLLLNAFLGLAFLN